MGNKSAKVCSVKRNYADAKTLEGSLNRHGFNRFPGTCIRMVPYKEANGTYRTGLDENALYIQRMPEAERAIEKARVKALYEDLTAKSGMDLSPRSDFYAKMFDSQYGENSRARVLKLGEGDNIFSLEDTFNAINFAWLRVHPQVAPSWEHYRTGKAGMVSFYVSDPEVEAEIIFTDKQAVNKAIVELDSMSFEKKRKVARLLGLPVSDTTKETQLYNLLDSFIKQGDVKTGEFKGRKSVKLFTELANMKDENLVLKDMIKQAFQHGIYRVTHGRIYEGQVELGISEEDLYEHLLHPKNQDQVMALEAKIKAKKSILE